MEKLGPKYRVALMSAYPYSSRVSPWEHTNKYAPVARDERWTRLTCDHKGTYADDVHPAADLGILAGRVS